MCCVKLGGPKQRQACGQLVIQAAARELLSAPQRNQQRSRLQGHASLRTLRMAGRIPATVERSASVARRAKSARYCTRYCGPRIAMAGAWSLAMCQDGQPIDLAA
jgi:hypothetical protein